MSDKFYWDKGTIDFPERCHWAVWSEYRDNQCLRKNGHGPDGRYCKQHAAKWNQMYNKETKQ